MAPSFHLRVASLETAHDLPGRFGEAGLGELADALGSDGDGDAMERLLNTMRSMTLTQLSGRMLDLILLQPPIPAGCEALVEAMKEGETPPWHDHEVVEDRVWLWYCHALLHRAFPHLFSKPVVSHVTLEVTPLTATARAPGARTASHDRVAFVAHALQQGPWSARRSDVDDWAYDTLWAVEVQGRTKIDAAAAQACGVSPEVVAAGKAHTVFVHAWMTEPLAAELEQGLTWEMNVPAAA